MKKQLYMRRWHGVNFMVIYCCVNLHRRLVFATTTLQSLFRLQSPSYQSTKHIPSIWLKCHSTFTKQRLFGDKEHKNKTGNWNKGFKSAYNILNLGKILDTIWAQIHSVYSIIPTNTYSNWFLLHFRALQLQMHDLHSLDRSKQGNSQVTIPTSHYTICKCKV